MRSIIQLVGVVVAVTTVVTGAQQQGTSPSQADADRQFVQQVGMGGMAEVEHGKLAAQNAASNDVKQFGQRMVNDHGKAGDELKALAARKQITLPIALDEKHRTKQNELSALKGAAFDRAYIAHMVMAHQETVATFQKEIKEGRDADVKAWAEKTLPTVEDHLKVARQLSPTTGS